MARTPTTMTKNTTTMTLLRLLLLVLVLSGSSSSSRRRSVVVEASAPTPDDENNVVGVGVAVGDDDDENEKKSGAGAGGGGGFRFAHKTVIIPHDEKKHRGGEDAASTTDTMLVVADGVGGWANRGVNPGLYSRKLVDLVTSSYESLSEEEKEYGKLDLVELAHVSNHAAADAHLGSATLTVVRLVDETTIETLNVGDSGYSIHRRYNRGSARSSDGRYGPNVTVPLKVVYETDPGQKGFNFPYQLGGRYGDDLRGDDDDVADGPKKHILRPKDVLVVYSDGVSDNIDPVGFHVCLQRYLYWSSDHPEQQEDADEEEEESGFEDGDVVSLSAAADCIARMAYFLGKDEKHYGPFARSAATYGKRYVGGKHDDITVTVAQVVSMDDDSSRLNNDDPHRSESIFLYEESHGPIQSADDLPTAKEILFSKKKKKREEEEENPVVVENEL
eukprot:CAMPEP_0197178654 /NCGR_PEP_ID=MMETSP1423-20130617/3871_1 /TAXON_ID=476441 /ORGANISM="Pseudo-nitzschia heimii, Strain UNC1101" /LENGTH=445 /DNA_ID=CAMNT_0042628439 /DNA_START=44 /DNA_END=1381 /DNA_ORIENTATION=+